ncbi:MAG: ImmA/IrrE family metallo-endopeptidase [Clostridia bacterium]|nr:ImmA/IrrE family metallo-endopeptidase [Clostridia bacterium]
MQNSLSRNTEKVERLYKLAEENNIPIDETCPESLISMSVRLSDGKKIIGLSNDENTVYTKLECLAHEMGHCMTDSFYAGFSPFELREKHEYKANVWAANEIVAFPALCKAVNDGMRELWELAEHFGVSHAFMEKAIKLHEQNGNTVPPELYAEN